jgi:hypothetical protein
MDAGEARRALEPMREMLAADGYDLRLEEASATSVRLRVVAGPEACDDCLVPKEVFAGIVRDRLPAEVAEVIVRYPSDPAP